MKGKLVAIANGELLTRDETAEFLGMTTRSLTRWQSKDYGPESFLVGGRRMYRAAAIEDWIWRQEHPSSGRTVQAPGWVTRA
jgi:hypothetical protein